MASAVFLIRQNTNRSRQIAAYKRTFMRQLRFSFPVCVYPNPAYQFPCGRKPERPEKTHD